MIVAEDIQYAQYRIGNAPILPYPFPHFQVSDVFPEKLYREIIEAIPPAEFFSSIGETGRVRTAASQPNAYDNRSVLDFTEPNIDVMPPENRELWRGLLTWLLGESFTMATLEKFGDWVNHRFGKSLSDARFFSDLQLVSDSTNYTLGPHTDNPSKVVVLLFYLPRDDSNIELGTSLYMPRDPALRCEGTVHHNRDQFTKVVTFPYRPNSVIGFFKSASSFHGVEPIAQPGVTRHLMQLSIRHGFPHTEDLARVS
ncbi:hypothetical protein OAJ57_00685 [Alphaproteobacteria bacterium]|nr:hypothetical protein [Alphaproteobacteria bacterium]